MIYISLYIIVVVLGQLIALFFAPPVAYMEPIWKWSWVYFVVNLAALMVVYLYWYYNGKR